MSIEREESDIVSLSRTRSGPVTRGPGHIYTVHFRFISFQVSKRHEDLSRCATWAEKRPTGSAGLMARRTKRKSVHTHTHAHTRARALSARLPMLNYLTIRADTHSSAAVSAISSCHAIQRLLRLLTYVRIRCQ